MVRFALARADPSPLDKRWLLVYDNFEDWETVRPYWQRSGNGSILITSQNPEIRNMFGSGIALQSLGREDGARLLLKHLGRHARDHDVAQAERISEMLGGLPMAISHMAGYIFKSKSTLEDFLDSFNSRDQTKRIWAKDCRNWTYQYPKALDQLWDISLEKLSNNARFLIFQLSMMNPDHIPEDFLVDHQGQRYSKAE